MYEPILPQPSNTITTDVARYSMFIKELSAQSFTATASRKYHFLFAPYTDIFMYYETIDLSTYGINDGVYDFDPPVIMPSSFTVNFGDPTELLTFADDRLTATMTTGTTTTLTFSTSHGFANASTTVVQLVDFTTTAASADYDLIQTLIDKDGHKTNNITSSTQLVIPINTTALSGTPSSCTVLFLDRRLFFAAEFTFLKYPKDSKKILHEE